MKAKRGKIDLYFLAKEILGYKDVAPEPHKEMCDFVEQSKKLRKLVLVPRGSFKTSVLVIAQTIQDIVNNPDIRILLGSEKMGLSIKTLKEVKERMTTPSFIELYGDMRMKRNAQITNWRESEVTVVRETKAKEPTVSCAGIDVVKVGFHYDKIYIDDCVSQQNVTNSEQIRQTLEWYRLLLSLPDPGGTVQITGTRYDFSDLYGTILDPTESMHDKFDIYVRPAIDKEGKLYFPTRLSQQFLDDQKVEQGNYLFSCQYLLHPVSAEDQTFKPEYIQYYEEESLETWNSKKDTICFERMKLNTYVCIDPAISQTETADYTGVVVVSIDRDSKWYIREAYQEKMQPSEIIKTLVRLKKKYNYNQAGIEMVSFAQSLQYFVKAEEKEIQESLRVVELKTNLKSKEYRIKGLQPYFERLQVYLKREQKDLIYQLLHFPRTTNDDILDSAAYIPTLLRKPSSKKGFTVGKVYNPFNR